MTKEQFAECVNEFKNLIEKADDHANKLERAGLSVNNWVVYDFMDAYISLLEYAVGDREIDRAFGSNIDWFIYETEFGTRCNKVIYEEDNSEHIIDSPEKLYDLIMDCKEWRGENE